MKLRGFIPNIKAGVPEPKSLEDSVCLEGEQSDVLSLEDPRYLQLNQLQEATQVAELQPA
jgi:hypothetical protein